MKRSEHDNSLPVWVKEYMYYIFLRPKDVMTAYHRIELSLVYLV